MPNPGSREAIKRGCTCPVLDNWYGEGARVEGKTEQHFYIARDCPIHTVADSPFTLTDDYTEPINERQGSQATDH